MRYYLYAKHSNDLYNVEYAFDSLTEAKKTIESLLSQGFNIGEMELIKGTLLKIEPIETVKTVKIED